MGLQHIKDAVKTALPIGEIKEQIKWKQPIRLNRYLGSVPSLLIAELAGFLKQMVIIFPDEETARFFTGDLEMLQVPQVHFFPISNNKPYQDVNIADSTTLVQRAEVLDAIVQSERNILVTSAQAVGEKIISPEAFSASAITIEKGMEISMDSLREKLISSGYNEVSFVDHPGEMASRGGIFDVFPFSGDYPIRFEFFGDEIDSIRHFDPDSQRSISFLDYARIVPNTSAFNQSERKHLLSYFSDDTVFMVFDAPLIFSETENQFELAEQIHATLKRAKNADPDMILPDPSDLYTTSSHIQKHLSEHSTIFLGKLVPDATDFAFNHTLSVSPQPDFNSSVKLLRDNLIELSGDGVITHILCDSKGQQERLEELLGEPSEQLNYVLSLETLHEGFILKEAGLAVYTDHQIFNRYHRPKTRRRKFSGGISFKELKDLNVGDFVVHVDFGIGKFAGFQKIKVRETQQEVVVLKYQAESILYVNITQLYKIQKFAGKDGHQPKVTKLGSGEWARKKAKTQSRVKDIARELIQLYAKRKAQQAHAFPPDNYMQTELEASFMFEETPDQLSAIEAVKKDMQSDMPMDRLICGDVGFGKTEIAVRAAFKAALDGKQVAVLVPTTILADQHFKTFSSRMESFPLNVEVLSRFRSAKEQKETIKRLKEGQVDILIGTHRITSKDVEFKDLGLLVIDEEQRFGVAMKEKIKRFRAAVDVLTMTATPIPRTLQFSLMGARDLSVINTPPPNRQPVLTEILTFDSARIRDAILTEISRGGQVFFIHNRVNTIAEISGMIMDLVPNIKVRFAHGQMKGAELERIIFDFYDHKFDVLVSTNIVENGIDIANANTIIINQANNFGLSELHQLRGRVGRSNRKAYCYLLAPPFNMLTMESRKRLMALVEFSDLGSGLNIAMRDLDIRGAGDILGGEQSGYIQDIGFELYTKILNDAVKELKKEEFGDLFEDYVPEVELPETTVEFDVPALLPAWFVSDSIERLNLYRRLSTSNSISLINEWTQEIKDRFGTLPTETQNLIEAAKVKLFASRLLITKVTIRANRMWLQCPSPQTEAGKAFYESGKMQNLIGTIQDKGHDVEAAQKKDILRLVVKGISGLEHAARFLPDVLVSLDEE